MLSLLSSRLVLRFVAAGLSDVAVIVVPPGRLVAVGRPLRCLFPVRCGLSWLVRFWRVRM